MTTDHLIYSWHDHSDVECYRLSCALHQVVKKKKKKIISCNLTKLRAFINSQPIPMLIIIICVLCVPVSFSKVSRICLEYSTRLYTWRLNRHKHYTQIFILRYILRRSCELVFFAEGGILGQ